MVHLIVMTEGTGAELEIAEALHKARSWRRIEMGVWLVATKVRASDYRDKLSVEVPGAKFLVAQLSGTWASHDVGRISEWLKGHSG